MEPGDPREGQFGAALLARMARNHMALVKVERAPTPIQIIFGWAEKFGLVCEPIALVDLAERLRGARLLIGEDGALLGRAIVEAMREQAANIKAWPERNRLRFAAVRLEDLLGAMGLL